MKGAKDELSADFEVGYCDYFCDVSFQCMWSGFADAGRTSPNTSLDPDPTQPSGSFAAGYSHSSNSHSKASQPGANHHF